MEPVVSLSRPLPLYVVFLGPVLGAGLLSLVAPVMIARHLALWEQGAFAAFAFVLLMIWRRRRARRQREQLQDLRDSALW
jgi:membrane protein implicated in regulation of membrane protease activity